MREPLAIYRSHLSRKREHGRINTTDKKKAREPSARNMLVVTQIDTQALPDSARARANMLIGLVAEDRSVHFPPDDIRASSQSLSFGNRLMALRRVHW